MPSQEFFKVLDSGNAAESSIASVTAAFPDSPVISNSGGSSGDEKPDRSKLAMAGQANSTYEESNATVRSQSRSCDDDAEDTLCD